MPVVREDDTASQLLFRVWQARVQVQLLPPPISSSIRWQEDDRKVSYNVSINLEAR